MKSVTTTYPGFHVLPKGIKRMLLFSENYFFGETRPATQSSARTLPGLNLQSFTPADPTLRPGNFTPEIHFRPNIATV